MKAHFSDQVSIGSRNLEIWFTGWANFVEVTVPGRSKFSDILAEN